MTNIKILQQHNTSKILPVFEFSLLFTQNQRTQVERALQPHWIQHHLPSDSFSATAAETAADSAQNWSFEQAAAAAAAGTAGQGSGRRNQGQGQGLGGHCPLARFRYQEGIFLPDSSALDLDESLKARDLTTTATKIQKQR